MNMKKIFILFAVIVMSFGMFSQSNTINIAGLVMDEQGEPLIGVTVMVKGTETGIATDYNGRFRLSNIPAGSTLVYSYIGFRSMEERYYESNDRVRIGMSEDVDELDELVVTARGTQRRVSVVGAITSVNADELQVPATSVSNMLGGRVPGIIAVSRSGEPGEDISDFWIRGIGTFGAKQGALVLIDGIEGNLNDLNPADIESFSILKDASSTAVYGVRGANGVVIVTTKRGRAGKLNINFRTNATYSYSPRMPEYADSYQYALLANEAMVVRGNEPLYSQTDLELYRTGLDPDLYPNVNWRNVILRDYSWNNQHHIGISGGGEAARYYVSLGYLNSEALFKQDSNSPFSANVNYNRLNFRANVDANVTKSTLLSLNIESVFVSQNSPGFGDNNNALWSAQANLPPNLVPVRYSNGLLPVYGSNADEMSPYVQLNYTGYKAKERYTTRTNLLLNQDLSMFLDGLSIQGLFSLTSNGAHDVYNNMRPDLYFADPKVGRNTDGSLSVERKMTKEDLTATQFSLSNRQYYLELQANYNQVFDYDHRVTGLIHAYRQDTKNSDWGDGVFTVIPERYQAYSARATYSYKDTYITELNVGYTGSENFNKESRYGIFPSVALGWVPTQYEWMKENIPFINFLKLRGSIGQVGNDRLVDSNGNPIRFPYLTIIGGVNSGIWGGTAISETQIGAVNMEWETSTKYNIGIDGKVFNDKIDFSVDFYRNKTTGIFQKRESVPFESGLYSTLPYANIGEMTSWGFDGHASYFQKINNDMNFTVRGNFTLSRNNVDNWEQAGVRYPYQSWSDVPYGIMRGLISEGLFKDEDDILSSPKQTYMSDVRPGDIKYKDVNGDGVINDDDIVPLSHSNIPEFQYGGAFEFNYKNFRINALLEGVQGVEYFLGGSGYYPFAWGYTGNILEMVTHQENRWTPASYSGNPATENPNARFPRLTHGENPNNNRASTFWLADGSYLRLKNVELTYTLPREFVQKLRFVESLAVSLVGDNLHVWDSVKLWDPGQASSNGAVYPLQRKYTIQLYATF